MKESELILDSSKKMATLVNKFLAELSDTIHPRDYHGHEKLFVTTMLCLTSMISATIIDKVCYVCEMGREPILKLYYEKLHDSFTTLDSRESSK